MDTVAMCGGTLDDLHLWMLDVVDIHTHWIELRALANRGQHSTCEQIGDIEKSLLFALLGADCDNGGEPERSGDSLPQAARRASEAKAIYQSPPRALFRGA